MKFGFRYIPYVTNMVEVTLTLNDETQVAFWVDLDEVKEAFYFFEGLEGTLADTDGMRDVVMP